MRLQRVEHGAGVKNRLILLIIRITSGKRVPDVIRTLLYRSEVFGQPYGRWLQSVMRGPGPWEVWERELFAAFTSRLNQCPF
ncbi:MAG TPA: hypothetical protein VIH93_00835 [Thermoanaerobaculia bacterium]|jgi:hypothetical protein